MPAPWSRWLLARCDRQIDFDGLAGPNGTLVVYPLTSRFWLAFSPGLPPQGS